MKRVGKPLGGALFAVVGLAAALFQIAIAFPDLDLPSRWMTQTLVLAVIWIALSVAPLLLRSGAFAIMVCALFRFIVYEIMAYPLVGKGGIQLTLLCALVTEAGMALASPVDILLPLAFVGLALLQPEGATAWDRPVPRLGFAQSALFAFILLTLIVFLRFYKDALRKAGDQQELIVRLKRTELDLIDTNIDLQEKIVNQEAKLLEMERSRISRELHDTIGYTLMNILAMQKAAAAILRKDPEQAGRFIAKTIEQSERGLRDTRTAIGSIRDRSSREATIAEVVTRLAKAFENTHIRISADLNNSSPSYGSEVDEALGRFVQEAITNAIKHGNADEIYINFWRAPEGLTVSVRDNGSGVSGKPASSEGIGIGGMRERFDKLGGTISMGNAYGGFRISAFVPSAACGDWR
jgi:signal transduction histidine kinase